MKEMCCLQKEKWGKVCLVLLGLLQANVYYSRIYRAFNDSIYSAAIWLSAVYFCGCYVVLQTSLPNKSIWFTNVFKQPNTFLFENAYLKFYYESKCTPNRILFRLITLIQIRESCDISHDAWCSVATIRVEYKTIRRFTFTINRLRNTTALNPRSSPNRLSRSLIYTDKSNIQCIWKVCWE